MAKTTPDPLGVNVPLHIGLGPGFTAGENCHAVVETRRGHTLGRVYWKGSALADSGEPDGDRRRVLRSSHDGVLISDTKIGESVKEGQVIAQVRPDSGGELQPITSPFSGVLRGLIRPESRVTKGMKIGDVDQRNDLTAHRLVSDKALAVSGGVLEALLMHLKTKQESYF